MDELKALSELIDVDSLQVIQDNCSTAMGLAFVTVDYKGVPVTRYSGFTPHCMMGRRIKGFAERCEQCDAHGGLHAAITGQPYIYRCHAGLVDFAVPIVVNGTYMGAVLGGQVRLQEESERDLDYILPQRPEWRRDPAWEETYRELQVTTYRKVLAAVNLLRDIIVTFLSGSANHALAQKLQEKDVQISELRRACVELENTLKKREEAEGRQPLDLHTFFFVMNILSRLAYEENAAKTEAVAYDFADLMRYASSAGQRVSTLGEELGYVGAMLRIRKAWFGDGLEYTFSVPEEYQQAACPFMILHSIMECVLDGLGGSPLKTRKLQLNAEEEKGRLRFEILTNDTGRSLGELTEALAGKGSGVCKALREADQLLRQTLSGSEGLMIGQRRDGQPGAAISFCLPLE